MIDAEDQDLVRRALQADAESFGQLCKRYYQPLVAVADSILLDRLRQRSPSGDCEMQQTDCGRGDGQMELVSEGLYGVEAHRYHPRPAGPGQSCRRRVGYRGHGNA